MTRRLLAALAVVTLSGGALFVPIQPAEASAGCAVIPVIAHRGGNERYVENTRNAFRDATNRGARSWETDVRFTSDDVPMIMHDETVDRTTDGTGLVSALTAAHVATLRTDDGQGVPTLAELINDAAVDGVTVFAEPKVNPTPAQWGTLLAAVNSRGLADRVMLISFDPATLGEAELYAPTMKRGLLGALGYADPETVTPYASSFLKHYDSVTSARMAAWTTGGLDTYVWTADTQTVWERMSRYPALHGLITNKPAAYLKWQKSRTSC